MRLHPLLARIALALLLLLGQQGAALHAQEHLAPAAWSGDEQQALQHHGCELCAGYAQLAGAAPATPLPPLEATAALLPEAAPGAPEAPAESQLPYPPRAPPRLA